MDDLTIINRALANTGNKTLTMQNDGSDEGNVAEASLQRAKGFVVGVYEWDFHTKTLVPTRLGASDMPSFTDALQYPPDCWHLRDVLDDQFGTSQPHRVMGGKIHTMTSINIKLFYVTDPTTDTNHTWHPLASEALTLFVESGIYRGLNEDQKSADDRWMAGEGMLARAAGRDGQQSSARNLYQSRTRIARRVGKIGFNQGWGW